MLNINLRKIIFHNNAPLNEPNYQYSESFADEESKI